MKPIKDTKLGHWLREKAPKILDQVGDLLPDSGALGIVKNLLSLENSPDLTPDQRMEVIRIMNEVEIEAMRDVQSARNKEIDFIRATGHIDWFQAAFGAAIIIMFAYTIWVSSTGKIPTDMREIFIEGRAAVRDIALSIAGYYWGSSASSRVKDMINRR